MKNLKTLFLTFFVIILLAFFSCKSNKQNNNNADNNIEKEIEQTVTEMSVEADSLTIYGTLVTPTQKQTFPVVLIIAGSGPTDRDGNNKLGVSAKPYKMLSDTLIKYGIATLRYDKRAVGQSYSSNIIEKDLRFDDYVNDAILWVEELKKDERFSKVIVLGHSEGSLIGIIASNKSDADAYISVAGLAKSADSLLMEQLTAMPNVTKEEVSQILEKIRNNELAVVKNPDLQSIFRFSVQPYISSWIAYLPKEEIAKLTIPTLIIHGTTDIQVDVSEAEKLAKASSNSKLVIIDGMNHILKNAPADTLKNSATYTNSKLPLNNKFCEEIVSFVNSL